MTTTEAAPPSRPTRSAKRRAIGAPTDIEIIEPTWPAYARTGGDFLRVAGAVVTLLAALLIAAVFRSSVSGADSDLKNLATSVPQPLAQALLLASNYTGFVGAIAVVIALILVRRLRVAVMVVVAAAAGALAMFGISRLLSLDVELPAKLGQLRTVAYSSVQVIAAASAVLTVMNPWLMRTWRRAGVALIAITAFTRIVSGADTPYDVAVAIVLGWLVGSLLLLIFGSPNRRPEGSAVAASLRTIGVDVVRLEYIGYAVRGSITYRADERDGSSRFVKVFSADQPESDRIVQYWRWLRLRDAAFEQPFASLRRGVEHEAFASLSVAHAGVRAAPYRGIAEVEPEGMLLLFDYVDGENLESVGPDGLTDAVLSDVWTLVAELQEEHIAHRDLRLAHVVLPPKGKPLLVDFGYSEVAANDLLLRNDIAELLCSTAVEVGAERAVQAAIGVMGKDAIGAALPRLQPLALRPITRKAMAKREGLLKELQTQVQRSTGIEAVQLEELARVRPRTVVSFAVIALVVYLLLPRLAEVSDIGATISQADWIWLIPLVIAQVFTYVGAGIAIEGSVPDPVPLFPTMRAQVAAAFADILAPAAVGGMALNTRFLQKKGVEPGVAVAGVGLNVFAGFVAHVALLGAFLLWVGSSNAESTTEIGSVSAALVITLIIVAAMLAILGLVIAVPPGRRLLQRRVVPLIRDAKNGIAELARRPRKLVALLGGSGLVTLGFLAALVFSVEAFGGDVPFPQLGVAYLLASTVAIVAPTPGGVGAVEAALIAALSKLGMSADAAVSAVFLFRTGTFWLPVAPGWVAFHWMQRKGEI